MKSGATREPNPVHVVEEFAPDDGLDYFLYPVRDSPLQTTVTINSKNVHMEVDIGASQRDYAGRDMGTKAGTPTTAGNCATSYLHWL